MNTDDKDVPSANQNGDTQVAKPQNLLTEYKSSELFQGKNELIITHAQEQYRLRITRHGKLILTK